MLVITVRLLYRLCIPSKSMYSPTTCSELNTIDMQIFKVCGVQNFKINNVLNISRVTALCICTEGLYLWYI